MIVIRALVYILPKMSGYVKTFKVKDSDKDKSNKLVSFCVNDEKLLEKCKTIWSKIEDIVRYYIKWFREHWQLGFVTLNSNLAINLKTTHPPFLNGRSQFTFLKTKLSHSSGIVVYPPKFGFLRN